MKLNSHVNNKENFKSQNYIYLKKIVPSIMEVSVDLRCVNNVTEKKAVTNNYITQIFTEILFNSLALCFQSCKT